MEPKRELLARIEELEWAASECEHWQKSSVTPGHKCGEYLAEVLRGRAKELRAQAADLPDAEPPCQPTLTECPRCQNDFRRCPEVNPPQAEPAGEIAELVKWARDMATGSVCKNLAMEMADALTSLSAQLELLATDKSVVRANLLRGTLARPDDVIFMHDTHGPFAEQSARIASLSAQLLHAQDQARLSERLFQDANAETAEKTARIASLEADLARARELLIEIARSNSLDIQTDPLQLDPWQERLSAINRKIRMFLQ